MVKTLRRPIEDHPPSFPIQSIRQWKLRYVTTMAGTRDFTVQDFSDIVGVTALTATTSSYLAASFRLRRITMWGPVAVAGTPVNVALDWNSTGSFASPGNAVSDTSISFDHPAFARAAPPKSSAPDFWHVCTNNSLPLVTLTYPSGCTVDFEVDFVINDQGTVVNGQVLVGATPGQIYHLTVGDFTAVILNTI
jgi:hypothetical protein